jgi:hypothetical protein
MTIEDTTWIPEKNQHTGQHALEQHVCVDAIEMSECGLLATLHETGES